MKQIKSQNQPWSHVLMGKFTLKCAHYTVVVFYCWGSLLLQWQQWSLPMMTSPVWHVPLWTALCPSARSSPHLPQSSVCCVGTQQLFAVSVVYYLSSHSCSLLPQPSVCCMVRSHTAAVCGGCCVLSARTLPRLPQSSVCLMVTHSGCWWWILCVDWLSQSAPDIHGKSMVMGHTWAVSLPNDEQRHQ